METPPRIRVRSAQVLAGGLSPGARTRTHTRRKRDARRRELDLSLSRALSLTRPSPHTPAAAVGVCECERDRQTDQGARRAVDGCCLFGSHRPSRAEAKGGGGARGLPGAGRARDSGPARMRLGEFYFSSPPPVVIVGVEVVVVLVSVVVMNRSAGPDFTARALFSY